MKLFLITTTLLLSACNLAASLTGGTRQIVFTPRYVVQGEEQSLEIAFGIKNGVVVELAIEPRAATLEERARQNAFAANVRQLVIGKTLAEITIPTSIGEERQLTEVFRGVLENVQGR